MLRLYKAKVLDKRIAAYQASNGEIATANISDDDKASQQSRRKKGNYIRVTWFYDLLSMAVFPILGVLSVLWCILWAADIFDMKDIVLYKLKRFDNYE